MQALSCPVSLSLACGSRLGGLILSIRVQGCWLRTTTLARRIMRASFIVIFSFIVPVLWSSLLLKDWPCFWEFLEWVLYILRCFIADSQQTSALRPLKSSVNTKSHFFWMTKKSQLYSVSAQRSHLWMIFLSIQFTWAKYKSQVTQGLIVPAFWSTFSPEGEIKSQLPSGPAPQVFVPCKPDLEQCLSFLVWTFGRMQNSKQPWGNVLCSEDSLTHGISDAQELTATLGRLLETS